jgi:DNA-binding transcriptional LysR family regulator
MGALAELCAAMDELLETAELSAFTRTVDAGSLSRASKELGVPRATIGRRLARLEERLGTRLIRRTTRSLVLTDSGRTLYAQAKLALDAVRDAVTTVRRSTGAVRGPLRVSIPPMPDASFGKLVTDFLLRYPDVQLDLHTSTAAVHFGEGGYDVAVRASAALDPGLVRRSLAETRLVVVATPTYLARRGTPRSPDELASHVCLLGHGRGDSVDHDWPLTSGGTLRVRGPLATNDLRLRLDAARASVGLALLPELLVWPYLSTGELVRVLDGAVGATSTVAVVYPERRLMAPVVRAFVDEVVRWGEHELPRMAEACEEAARPRGRAASEKVKLTAPKRSAPKASKRAARVAAASAVDH